MKNDKKEWLIEKIIPNNETNTFNMETHFVELSTEIKIPKGMKFIKEEK